MRSTLALALIVIAPAVIAPTLDAYAALELRKSACAALLPNTLSTPAEIAARHWHALRCAREMQQ